MEKTTIKLQSHDNSKNYLLKIGANKYMLKTQFNLIRSGRLPDGSIFIDPSGGPMLVEGKTIEGTLYTIKSIEFRNGHYEIKMKK
jgi:hypothetical protein